MRNRAEQKHLLIEGIKEGFDGSFSKDIEIQIGRDGFDSWVIEAYQKDNDSKNDEKTFLGRVTPSFTGYDDIDDEEWAKGLGKVLAEKCKANENLNKPLENNWLTYGIAKLEATLNSYECGSRRDSDREKWVESVNETLESYAKKEIGNQLKEQGLELGNKHLRIEIGRKEDLQGDQTVRAEAVLVETGWGGKETTFLIAEKEFSFGYVSNHLYGIKSGLLREDVKDFLGMIENNLDKERNDEKESELYTKEVIFESNTDGEKTEIQLEPHDKMPSEKEPQGENKPKDDDGPFERSGRDDDNTPPPPAESPMEPEDKKKPDQLVDHDEESQGETGE